MLYLCRFKPLRHYLRGFLIAAWAGDKIAEFSFPEILFHFPLRPWFFFVSPRVCGEKPLRKRVCSSALGSPPRMRGKVGDHAVIGVHHRSTPAHAGKSHCSRRRATALRDHPRACGEKPRVSSPIGRQMGSPPRMRGKGEVEAGKESVDRITPAYAGKRGRCPRPAGRRWDHPRVCGEKIRARLHPRFLVGSPPRMRGKERKRCCTATGTGITLAYAGKSRLHTSVLPWRRDHPRICGEKERWQGIWNSGVGSPPRMRGKGNVSHYHEQEPRITPAYAGKRMDCLEY